MSIPTSVPYRFCTTLANRAAASVLRRLVGFVGGGRVPSGEHNDLFGFLSDWVTYWHAEMTYDRVWPVGQLPWIPQTGQGALVIEPQWVGSDPVGPIDSEIIFRIGGSSGSREAIVAVPVERAGRLVEVKLLDAVTDASGSANFAFVSTVEGGSVVSSSLGDADLPSVAAETIIYPEASGAIIFSGPGWCVFRLLISGDAGDEATFSGLHMRWEIQ